MLRRTRSPASPAVMVTGELGEVTVVATQRVRVLVGVGKIGEELSHW